MGNHQGQSSGLGGCKAEETNRFRRTIAASTWAYYSDPGGYTSNAKNAAVSSKLAATILRGVRGPDIRDIAAEAELHAAQTAADQAAAKELLALVVGKANSGHDTVAQPRRTRDVGS